MIVRMDGGSDFRTVVRSKPRALGDGTWVVGLVGKGGGYSLERVLRRVGRGDACGRTVRAEAVQPAGQAGVQAVRGLPGEGQGPHAAEARVLPPGPLVVVPDILTSKVEGWLRTNKLDGSEVQWAAFPVGMVNGWVQRALEAEETLSRLEGRQSS